MIGKTTYARIRQNAFMEGYEKGCAEGRAEQLKLDEKVIEAARKWYKFSDPFDLQLALALAAHDLSGGHAVGAASGGAGEMKPMVPAASERVAYKLSAAETEYAEGYSGVVMSSRNALLICHMMDAVNEAYRDGHAAGFAEAIEMAARGRMPRR